MELNSKNYSSLKSFFDWKKNKKYSKLKDVEFEVRFNTKHNYITYDIYKQIFFKLTFDKTKGGLNFKNITQNTILSVSDNTNEFRINLLDNNDIKKFWLLNQFQPDFNYEIIRKNRLENIDIDDYNLRFMLSHEEKLSDKSLENVNEILRNDTEKLYRLKNRYSIVDDSGLFRFDLTTVKDGKGTDFKNSNTLKNPMNYEIEIEFIGNKENLDLLLKYCLTIIEIIQGNTLKQDYIEDIKNSYFGLIGISGNNENGNYEYETKKNFIVANAVTLHLKNIIKSDQLNIYNKYCCTLKADGERHLLFVHNGDFILMDINYKLKKLDFKNTELNNTIIEGEYINDKLFLIYDILYYKGEDVRSNQFKSLTKEKDRFYYLNQFLSKVKMEKDGFQIKLKKYLFSVKSDGSDIFEKADELWSTRKNNDFYVDGVIFMPMLEYYPIKSGSWYSLFKWKPESQNSIDFLVKVQKNKNGIEEKKLYSMKENSKEGGLTQYKTLDLHVGGKNGSPVKFLYKDDENYSYANILLKDDKMLIDNEGEIQQIYDDSIVEFIYDKTKENGFKWVPIKIRNDKTMAYKSGKKVFGNFEKIAYDIFENIMNPVTVENITTGVVDHSKVVFTENKYYNKEYNANERMNYQNFHNLTVKDQLFNYISKENKKISGKLLDLASGKGGDINRWKKYKFAEVVGLDNDIANIEYARNLFTKIARPKPKTYYIHSDISKLIFPTQEAGCSDSAKLRLRQYIPKKEYFDNISIFFAIHYMYGDEITFRTLIQNMADNIKMGGNVIGTCFNGYKIYSELKKENKIEGDFYNITKKYKSFNFDKKKPNFGKKIDVYINSIGKTHSEYLVNVDYLETIFNQYGFEKVEINDFESIYEKDKNKIEYLKNMSENEKEFSFMNSYFIFKKVKETPPRLLQKLLVDMKKKTSTISNELESNIEFEEQKAEEETV